MITKELNQNEIIIVDDNPDDRMIARVCFSRALLKNPWMEFASGSDLLNYLALVEKGSKPLPALILLDINMPEMTGIETLEVIRKRCSFRTLPIVAILSGSENEEDISKAKALGADAYISKPADVNGYISLFKSFSANILPAVWPS